MLAERVGEGSWTLPIEIAWMPPEQSPTSFGAEQFKAFVALLGWSANEVPDVDLQYAVRPFLEPVTAAGVNVLGRVRNNRCFHLPVASYSDCGRPAQPGANFKLNDAGTFKVKIKLFRQIVSG